MYNKVLACIWAEETLWIFCHSFGPQSLDPISTENTLTVPTPILARQACLSFARKQQLIITQINTSMRGKNQHKVKQNSGFILLG